MNQTTAVNRNVQETRPREATRNEPAQRSDLGVRLPRVLVPAASHDRLAIRDDTADARIGVGRVEPPGGQLQSQGHALAIKI